MAAAVGTPPPLGSSSFFGGTAGSSAGVGGGPSAAALPTAESRGAGGSALLQGGTLFGEAATEAGQSAAAATPAPRSEEPSEAKANTRLGRYWGGRRYERLYSQVLLPLAEAIQTLPAEGCADKAVPASLAADTRAGVSEEAAMSSLEAEQETSRLAHERLQALEAVAFDALMPHAEAFAAPLTVPERIGPATPATLQQLQILLQDELPGWEALAGAIDQVSVHLNVDSAECAALAFDAVVAAEAADGNSEVEWRPLLPLYALQREQRFQLLCLRLLVSLLEPLDLTLASQDGLLSGQGAFVAQQPHRLPLAFVCKLLEKGLINALLEKLENLMGLVSATEAFLSDAAQTAAAAAQGDGTSGPKDGSSVSASSGSLGANGFEAEAAALVSAHCTECIFSLADLLVLFFSRFHATKQQLQQLLSLVPHVVAPAALQSSRRSASAQEFDAQLQAQSLRRASPAVSLEPVSASPSAPAGSAAAAANKASSSGNSNASRRLSWRVCELVLLILSPKAIRWMQPTPASPRNSRQNPSGTASSGVDSAQQQLDAFVAPPLTDFGLFSSPEEIAAFKEAGGNAQQLPADAGEFAQSLRSLHKQGRGFWRSGDGLECVLQFVVSGVFAGDDRLSLSALLQQPVLSLIRQCFIQPLFDAPNSEATVARVDLHHSILTLAFCGGGQGAFSDLWNSLLQHQLSAGRAAAFQRSRHAASNSVSGAGGRGCLVLCEALSLLSALCRLLPSACASYVEPLERLLDRFCLQQQQPHQLAGGALQAAAQAVGVPLDVHSDLEVFCLELAGVLCSVGGPLVARRVCASLRSPLMPPLNLSRLLLLLLQQLVAAVRGQYTALPRQALFDRRSVFGASVLDATEHASLAAALRVAGPDAAVADSSANGAFAQVEFAVLDASGAFPVGVLAALEAALAAARGGSTNWMLFSLPQALPLLPERLSWGGVLPSGAARGGGGGSVHLLDVAHTVLHLGASERVPLFGAKAACLELLAAGLVRSAPNASAVLLQLGDLSETLRADFAAAAANRDGGRLLIAFMTCAAVLLQRVGLRRRFDSSLLAFCRALDAAGSHGSPSPQTSASQNRGAEVLAVGAGVESALNSATEEDALSSHRQTPLLRLCGFALEVFEAASGALQERPAVAASPSSQSASAATDSRRTNAATPSGGASLIEASLSRARCWRVALLSARVLRFFLRGPMPCAPEMLRAKRRASVGGERGEVATTAETSSAESTAERRLTAAACAPFSDPATLDWRPTAFVFCQILRLDSAVFDGLVRLAGAGAEGGEGWRRSSGVNAAFLESPSETHFRRRCSALCLDVLRIVLQRDLLFLELYAWRRGGGEGGGAERFSNAASSSTAQIQQPTRKTPSSRGFLSLPGLREPFELVPAHVHLTRVETRGAGGQPFLLRLCPLLRADRSAAEQRAILFVLLQLQHRVPAQLAEALSEAPAPLPAMREAVHSLLSQDAASGSGEEEDGIQQVDDEALLDPVFSDVLGALYLEEPTDSERLQMQQALNALRLRSRRWFAQDGQGGGEASATFAGVASEAAASAASTGVGVGQTAAASALGEEEISSWERGELNARLLFESEARALFFEEIREVDGGESEADGILNLDGGNDAVEGQASCSTAMTTSLAKRRLAPSSSETALPICASLDARWQRVEDSVIESADAAVLTALLRFKEIQQKRLRRNIGRQQRASADAAGEGSFAFVSNFASTSAADVLSSAAGGASAPLSYFSLSFNEKPLRESPSSAWSTPVCRALAAAQLRALLFPPVGWLLPPSQPPEDFLFQGLPASACVSAFHSASPRVLCLTLLERGVHWACAEGRLLSFVPFSLQLLGLGFEGGEAVAAPSAAALSVLPPCCSPLDLRAANALRLRSAPSLFWRRRALDVDEGVAGALIAALQREASLPVPALSEELPDLPPHALGADGRFAGEGERQTALAAVYEQLGSTLLGVQLLARLASHPQTRRAATHAVGLLWPDRFRFLERQLMRRMQTVPLVLRPSVLFLLSASASLCREDIELAAAVSQGEDEEEFGAAAGSQLSAQAALLRQKQRAGESRRSSQLSRVCTLLLSPSRPGQRDVLSAFQHLLSFFAPSVDLPVETPLETSSGARGNAEGTAGAEAETDDWLACADFDERPSLDGARREVQWLCGVPFALGEGTGEAPKSARVLLSPQLFLAHLASVMHSARAFLAARSGGLSSQEAVRQRTTAATVLWIELFRRTYQTALKTALHSALSALPALASSCFALLQRLHGDEEGRRLFTAPQTGSLLAGSSFAEPSCSPAPHALLSQQAVESMQRLLTAESVAGCSSGRQVYGLAVLQHLFVLAWSAEATASGGLLSSRAFPLQLAFRLALLLTDAPALLPPAVRALLYGSLSLLLQLPAEAISVQEDEAAGQDFSPPSEGAAAAAAASAGVSRNQIASSLMADLRAAPDKYSTLVLLLLRDAAQPTEFCAGDSAESSSFVSSVEKEGWLRRSEGQSSWQRLLKHRIAPELRGLPLADDPECLAVFGLRSSCLPLAALRVLLLLFDAAPPRASGSAFLPSALMTPAPGGSDEADFSDEAPALAAVCEVVEAHLTQLRLSKRQMRRPERGRLLSLQRRVAEAVCRVVAKLCESSSFAWQFQVKRLREGGTALERLLSSPLLQAFSKARPVGPALLYGGIYETCWPSTGAGEKRGSVLRLPPALRSLSVVLPPLELLLSFISVLERLLSERCCSANALSLTLRWLQNEEEIVEAPLRVVAHIAALCQQERLLGDASEMQTDAPSPPPTSTDLFEACNGNDRTASRTLGGVSAGLNGTSTQPPIAGVSPAGQTAEMARGSWSLPEAAECSLYEALYRTLRLQRLALRAALRLRRRDAQVAASGKTAPLLSARELQWAEQTALLSARVLLFLTTGPPLPASDAAEPDRSLLFASSRGGTREAAPSLDAFLQNDEFLSRGADATAYAQCTDTAGPGAGSEGAKSGLDFLFPPPLLKWRLMMATLQLISATREVQNEERLRGRRGGLGGDATQSASTEWIQAVAGAALHSVKTLNFILSAKDSRAAGPNCASRAEPQLTALVVAVCQCSLDLLRRLLLSSSQREALAGEAAAAPERSGSGLGAEQQPGVLHASAGERFAASFADCAFPEEFGCVGLKGGETRLSAAAVTLSPLLPVLVEALPSLRRLCVLSSENAADHPTGAAEREALQLPDTAAQTARVGGVSEGVSEEELSCVAFFAARLEVVLASCGGGAAQSSIAFY